jgi:hypothetical protein
MLHNNELCLNCPELKAQLALVAALKRDLEYVRVLVDRLTECLEEAAR